MNKILSAISTFAYIVFLLTIATFGSSIDNEKIFSSNEVIELKTEIPAKYNSIKVYTNQTQYTPYIDNYINYNSELQNVDIPEDEIKAIAKMLYGECGSKWISIEEKAACVWVACNRVDSEDSYFPDTIIEVIEQNGGFYGYDNNNQVTEELYNIARDVLTRWYSEYDGMPYDSGRVLPKDYLWFSGNGYNNTFRNAYKWPYDIWDFSLESPYEVE